MTIRDSAYSHQGLLQGRFATFLLIRDFHFEQFVNLCWTIRDFHCGQQMYLLAVSTEFASGNRSNLAKIPLNRRFCSKHELIWARTFDRMIIKTWLKYQMKGLDMLVCIFYSLGQIHPRGLAEFGQNDFQIRKKSNRWSVGAFSCFTNASLFKRHLS